MKKHELIANSSGSSLRGSSFLIVVVLELRHKLAVRIENQLSVCAY